MYEFQERVRYSETTEHGVCSILALVNYLQDCSTFHSEDVNAGVEYLKQEQRAWLLCYWDIHITRLPRLCERIVVGTCPHAIRGILAHRNFWIRSEADGYLVKADSMWFNVNLKTGRPDKIDPAWIAPYGEMRDVLGLENGSRKVELPEALETGRALVIQQHHIDSNHHVNNAQYIAIAAEAAADLLPAYAAYTPKRIRAEYRKAAMLNDRMVPYIGQTADGVVISLRNENGETYANVEFR